MVFATMAVLVGASIVAAERGVDVTHDPLSWMPKGDPTVKAIDDLDEHIGGSIDMSLLIKPTSELGMKDRALLLALARLDNEIRAYRHPSAGAIVGNSVSVLDVVRETNRALHNGDAEHYGIPKTQRAIQDALFVFESAGRDELHRLATPTLDKGHLSFQIQWLDATAYRGFLDHVDAAIRSNIDPSVATVDGTGAIYTVVGVVSKLIDDLLRSFGVAFLAITGLMVLLFRNVKLGLIAMIPNLLPIVLILGVMGLVGIPMDLNNLLIASLVIGIAVDDTIHFFHHFKMRLDATGDREASLTHSLRFAGRAMASTSMILCVGFLVYTGAHMTNLVRFGLLVAIAAVFALVVDIVLGSALIRAFYRTPGASNEESPSS
jgi:predicted RND superfamily exporter protein